MITDRNQAHDFVGVRSGTDATVDFGGGTQAERSARPRKLRPNSLAHWGADLATRSPAVPQTRFRREGLDLR